MYGRLVVVFATWLHKVVFWIRFTADTFGTGQSIQRSVQNLIMRGILSVQILGTLTINNEMEDWRF